MNDSHDLSNRLLRRTLLGAGLGAVLQAQRELPYKTYASFDQVREAGEANHVRLTRVSDPGTSERPYYTGFFFYECLQFDPTGRYLLGMRVYAQNRAVRPDDRGDIGFFDLMDGNKWVKIGETTAWNWQQGARLQWRPHSEEIVWNDRSDDGRSFVARIYDFRTRRHRVLPRPIYDISPDGSTALTHDFERMKHAGTDCVGIADRYKEQVAPDATGIWKMDMETGKTGLLLSLDKMAGTAYRQGRPATGCLYFFREGWNPSGRRFIAFVKDPDNKLFDAYSMAADGSDVRYLYRNPSHHAWLGDKHIIDFGTHRPPGGGEPITGYFLFEDDGSGEAKELLFPTRFDGHMSFVPGKGGDWILSDSYDIEGYQHLFLYHRPSKSFVPLARLENHAPLGVHRVDLHPRMTRDGRTVCIDSTYEGFGRQMYVMEIGHILDHPPGA